MIKLPTDSNRPAVMATLVLVVAAALITPPAAAHDVPQLIVSNDAAAFDFFGNSVAVHNGVVVVGVPNDRDNGDLSGSAYIFDAETSQQLAKLLAPDGTQFDSFGHDVATDGNYVVVGAPKFNQAEGGAAYVFDPLTGAFIRKLTASDSQIYWDFGWSVACSEGIALIGAPAAHSSAGQFSGAVYVFDLATGQELQKIAGPTGGQFLGTGMDVDIAGNVALIGCGVGGAFVYDVALVQHGATLVPSSGPSSSGNGFTVALSDDLAVVGDATDDSLAGALYVFDISTGNELRKISINQGQGELLGKSLSASGGRALVGRDHFTSPGPGSAHLVDLATGQVLANYSEPTAPINANDNFGWAVSLKGDRAVVGTPASSVAPSGVAYTISISTTPFVVYGAGCGGTGGVVPVLTMSGAAEPGATLLLNVADGVGSGTAFLVVGLVQAETPMGWGCVLNVGALLPAVVGPLPLGPVGGQGPGAGSVSLSAPLPGSIVGPFSFALQAFVADPGVPSGFSNSNGIHVNVR